MEAGHDHDRIVENSIYELIWKPVDEKAPCSTPVYGEREWHIPDRILGPPYLSEELGAKTRSLLLVPIVGLFDVKPGLNPVEQPLHTERF
jgi:hypothetical protein